MLSSGIEKYVSNREWHELKSLALWGRQSRCFTRFFHRSFGQGGEKFVQVKSRIEGTAGNVE